jgi:hypothetical protein
MCAALLRREHYGAPHFALQNTQGLGWAYRGAT